MEIPPGVANVLEIPPGVARVTRQRRGLLSNMRLKPEFVQMGTWAILRVVLESTPFASICAHEDIGYFRVGFKRYALCAGEDLSYFRVGLKKVR